MIASISRMHLTEAESKHEAMQRKGGGETMEKVKEMLMQQMELLHERAKKTRKADELVILTGSMRGLSAEIRNIEGKAEYQGITYGDGTPIGR